MLYSTALDKIYYGCYLKKREVFENSLEFMQWLKFRNLL
jgi:hypothetical protein